MTQALLRSPHLQPPPPPPTALVKPVTETGALPAGPVRFPSTWNNGDGGARAAGEPGAPASVLLPRTPDGEREGQAPDKHGADAGKSKALLTPAPTFTGLLETRFNASVAFAAQSQKRGGIHSKR